MATFVSFVNYKYTCTSIILCQALFSSFVFFVHQELEVLYKAGETERCEAFAKFRGLFFCCSIGQPFPTANTSTSSTLLKRNAVEAEKTRERAG